MATAADTTMTTSGGAAGGQAPPPPPPPPPPAAAPKASQPQPPPPSSSSSYVEMTDRPSPSLSPSPRQQDQDHQQPLPYHHAPWWWWWSATTCFSSPLTKFNGWKSNSNSGSSNNTTTTTTTNDIDIDTGGGLLPSSCCSSNSNCCCCCFRRGNPNVESFWNELKELVQDLVEYGRTKTWKKKVMTVVLCVSSTVVFYDLLFGSYITTGLRDYVLWTADNPHLAVVAFVSIFVVSTLVFIPPVLLVFGAGYAFTSAFDVTYGVLIATLTCFVGSSVGAVLCFVRSRYMMRDLIYLFARRYPLVRAADRALKRNGLHLMLLLRSCPMIPFNGLNHCCGVTGVSLHDFTVSLVGVLPYQIYTIMLGATTATLGQNLQDDASDNTRAQLVAFVVVTTAGTVFGLVAMVYAWRAIRHELKKELHLSSEEFEHLVHPNTSAPTATATTNTTDNENGGGSSCGGGTDPTCAYVGGPASAAAAAAGPAAVGGNAVTSGNGDGSSEQAGGGGQTLLSTAATDFDFHLQQQPQQQQQQNQGGEGGDDYGIEAGIYRDDDEKWYWVWA